MKQTLTKRIIFLTCLFLLDCLASQAQWSRIRNIYGGALANDGALSFSTGGKGYVVAGSSTDKIYEYDTAGNTWTQKGSVPAGAGQAFAMSFVVKGVAYIIGGDTGGHPVATVWAYDPLAKTNAWTRKNDFPGGLRDAGFGFAVNNTGYVGCGFDGTNLQNDFWKYDDAGDTWTLQPNSIPVIGLIFPAAFVAGNKAYVTGGSLPSGSETNAVWAFDPAANTWTSASPFPAAARQAAFAFSNNSFGFVGGGQSGYATVYNDMWRYNPAGDSWSQVQDAPLIGPAWASAFVIGNTAFVGLGAAFTATGLVGADSFYKYRIAATTAIAGNGSYHASWSVYPNPAGSTLQLQGEIPPGAGAMIFDNTGRLVKEAGNIQNRQIDVRDLPAGIYTIRICPGTATGAQRFVKKAE
jgi:N-acetylneuraminic acid mutarotase